MHFKRIVILVLLCTSLFACSSSPKLSTLSADSTIVAFGDSLTTGFGAPKQDSYPAILETLIHRRVINAGFNGLETSHALKLLPEVLAKYHPNLVILCIGGNDFLRRRDIALIKHNIEQMIYQLKVENIEVVLIAVPKAGVLITPPGFYKDIAEKYEVPVELKLLGRLERNSEYKSDVVHLNARGYREMAEGIAVFLKKLGAI